MGRAAASMVHSTIRSKVAARGSARIIMACAPSQDDFYAALIPLVRQEPDVWNKVTIFHMDEYVGLTAAQPQSFRSHLRRAFLDHVTVAGFHPIQGEATDIEVETRRYAALLEKAPIDVISLGIGENGHIAFNDPPVAEFHDARLVKRVDLDPICRQQQVNDGCFSSLDEVPLHAITLTLPVFSRAGTLVCIVPGARKAEAVKNTLFAPVGTACPATLLRQHPDSHLFLDPDSASLLIDHPFVDQ
jgi:glucosamine-6-phosphate deaminase